MNKKTILAFALITALFGCATGNNSAAVFAQTTPERRVFELVNIERQEDMLRNNFLGERGSDGAAQSRWFARAGIDFEVNFSSILMVYRGNNTPKQMLAEWMRNNSNRAKILSENNIIGVGIVPTPAGSADRNAAYWTVLIGSLPDHHPLIVGEKPRYPNVPMASVSSRYRYALAVRGDGTLWSWGCNELGQLGHGVISRRNPTPIKIGTDTDWKSLSLGDSFIVAIKNDGSVWTWGEDDMGQLGDGKVTKRHSPLRIMP